MFLCNYQVNFTQTFEKSQKVKFELDVPRSVEVDVDEKKRADGIRKILEVDRFICF